ncbi:MAG: WD40 repeat domain-containing protein [Armatimonadota bacterium]
MKAWRKLTLEKRNALVVLVILLVGFSAFLLTIRPEASPVVKLWERTHGDSPSQRHEIAFSSDGEHIITAAQTVKIWRTKDGQMVRSFQIGVKDAIKAISPDGQWIATYGRDGTVQLWRLLEGKIVRTLKGERGTVLSLAFSPNGKFIAAGSGDLGVVKVWQVERGDLVQSLSLGAGKITNLAISPSGEFLAATTLNFNPKQKQQGEFLELWHLPTGRRLYSVEMPIRTGRLYLLAPSSSIWVDRFIFSFSPNGEILMSTGIGWKGYTVGIWRVHDGKLDKQIALQGVLMTAGFTPHDSSLFLVHENTSRDLLTSLRPRNLTVPAFWVCGDVLTCRRLTESGLEKCWEVKNLITTPLGINDIASAFAFSPDGQFMAIVTLGGARQTLSSQGILKSEKWNLVWEGEHPCEPNF